MNKNALFLIFLSILAGLNVASVRKSEDPIRDTQTSGILYEQKKEEEKDGKKGPLMYHVRNNPREAFFIDPPIEAEPKSSPKVAATEVAPASRDATGWWEEQPTGPEAASPAEEAAALPSPEPLPEEEPVPEVKDAEKDAEAPAAAADAENAPADKGGDYWW